MSVDDTVVRSPLPRRTPRRLPGCLGAVFNLLSLLFVFLTCISAVVIAAIFYNPSLLATVGGRALLLATQPALLVFLGTPTPFVETTPDSGIFPTLPPAWTPTDTPTVTPRPPGTDTPAPAGTPAGARTPGATPTGPTPTASATRAAFLYTLQNGAVTYLDNFVNSSGCNWFGIVGQAFGLDGRPVIGLTVHLEGDDLSLDALTGSQPAIGPAGYEIPLGNTPIATTNTYSLQLRNNTGTALSERFVIKTFDECDKNLVMVSFVQNH